MDLSQNQSKEDDTSITLFHPVDKRELRIRFACAKDISTVLFFIKALAEFEKASHLVEATEASLMRSLFSGDKNCPEVALAYWVDPKMQDQEQPLEDQEEIIGFCIWFHNFSTWKGRKGMYLEDLFVLPEHRGFGVGKQLLSFLARLSLIRDCGRLEWNCLDWNTPAIDFYL